MGTFGKIAVALALCVSWLSAGTAAASDAKAYPGSVCVKSGSGGTIVYNNGRIGNGSSTEDLVLECPLVKDELSSGGIQSAYMFVVDRSPKSVECTLYSVEYVPASGGLNIWGLAGDPTSSTGSTSAHQYLIWERPPLFLNADGYHFFRCTIPPTSSGNRSWIASFWVEEYSP